MPVLEETNDIGFQAVEVREGASVAPGVWMRLVLGGITGHHDFARDTGIVCAPKDCVAVADAIVRVFIENGDRTNRNKARLKYVLDAWGFEKFLTAVEEKLGRPLARVAAGDVAPRPATDRFAHIGVHPQKQAGLNWVGVVLPVGKLTTEQMRELAAIARECGDGDIRLTVWQNFLFSGVPDARVAEVEARIAALGLSTKASSIRAGLVACTGNRGCKFAASDTKGHALMIAEHVEARLALDVPVNIHLTGCHHSCAQHYIGDIGLIGAKVAGRRRRRHGRGLPHRRRRRLRRERQDRPRAVEGHPGGGLSRPHRGAAAGLSGAPPWPGGELPGLYAAARARRAALPCLPLNERRRPSRRRGDLGFSGEGGGRMTMHAAPPTLLIPESAPFSPDQRAWLSGYFAALLSPELSGATPLSPADAAGLAGDAPAGPMLADAGDAPWHDPAFALTSASRWPRAARSPRA